MLYCEHISERIPSGIHMLCGVICDQLVKCHLSHDTPFIVLPFGFVAQGSSFYSLEKATAT